MDAAVPLVLAGVGIAGTFAALLLMKKRTKPPVAHPEAGGDTAAKGARRSSAPFVGARMKGADAFVMLDTKPAEALARIAPPPLDLSRPIATEADWRAIRAHARDAPYRAAVDQVRGRYRFANPMLLSNTLRTTMEKSGITFREAIIAIARDDGLR